MDLQSASAQIDTLIERRAREKNKANELEKLWKASERAHNERLRRRNRAAWYAFHDRMSELHARLSSEHAARAEALCEEGSSS